MRVSVIASASGNGKTTVGRELAGRLGVEFVELDALVHLAGWRELPDELLRQRLAPVLARDGWVIDGVYLDKLGTEVLDAAELVVWLDLPVRVWFPRLVRRSWRRLRGLEQLWNGNRESLRGVLWGRESLFAYALRSHFVRRRTWPVNLNQTSVVRLRTTTEVERFLASFAPASEAESHAKAPASGN